MRCKDVRQTLVGYLDGEVTLSERMLLEAHLAGCKGCESELSAFRAGRGRVADSLETMAVHAAPGPEALSRLQNTIAEELRTRTHKQGDKSMKLRWKIAFGTISAVVLAAAVIAVVPSTRAAAGDLLVKMFSLEMKPLELGYVPEGFVSMPVYQMGSVDVTGSDAATSGATAATLEVADQEQQALFQSGDQFVLVSTSKGTDEPLPIGEAAAVNGLAAVLQTGLSGTVGGPLELGLPGAPGVASGGANDGDASVTVSGNAAGPDGPTLVAGSAEGGSGVIIESGSVGEGSAQADAATGSISATPSQIEPLTYENASRLTWIVNGTRVELLSNLPLEELLKVAEGLLLDD